DGSSITGPNYEYIVFDNATTTSYTLSYKTASTDKSKATLTVRDHLTDTPTVVPATGWEYASDNSIRLLPAGTAFKQSAIYEFTYTAIDPVVAGIGIAAGDGVALNYRFAQPGRTERNRQNHLYPEAPFPFSYAVQTDALTGKTDGRNLRCQKTNTCPRIMSVNSANEYWVKAGSLVHT